MNNELLLTKIASSSNPLAEIDALQKDVSVGFVEYLNQTTWALVSQKNLSGAYKVNEWAVRIAHNLRNFELEAHTLFNRAQLERKIGQVDLAEQTFRDALLLYEKYGSPVDLLDGTAGLLGILESQDKHGEIMRVAERSLDILLAADQFPGAIKDPLLKICNILSRQAVCQLTRTYLSMLRQLGEQFGDQESEAAACGMLAETYVEEDCSEALRLFQRALELDRLNQNTNMQAIDLGNLGYVSYRLGDLNAAAQYFTECIAIRDRDGYTSGIEMDLYRFYHVCHYLDQRAEALQLSTRLTELTTGAPKAFRLAPMMYHIQLDERGEKTDGIQIGRP